MELLPQVVIRLGGRDIRAGAGENHERVECHLRTFRSIGHTKSPLESISGIPACRLDPSSAPDPGVAQSRVRGEGTHFWLAPESHENARPPSDAWRITRVIARTGGRTGSGLGQASAMTGLTCTIVVSGELGERFVGAFAGLALAPQAGTTRLTGVLIDQAELNGVLHQLMDLGLEIISIATTRQAESA